MPTHLRKAQGVLPLLAVLFMLPGCHDETSAPPPPATSSAPVPVDHLRAGELEEGDLVAFGLKLPKGLRLHYRGPTRVEADGNLPADRVANYVRERTKAQTVELGAARTVFEQAKVLGVESTRRLRIEVVTLRFKTRVIVRDLTPPRVNPGMTPEQRWKRHGFDKDGKLIDPNKMM